MKLNKIDEVWNSANLLFKWIFGLLSTEHFATMATWCNDVSSVLQISHSDVIRATLLDKESIQALAAAVQYPVYVQFSLSGCSFSHSEKFSVQHLLIQLKIKTTGFDYSEQRGNVLARQRCNRPWKQCIVYTTFKRGRKAYCVYKLNILKIWKELLYDSFWTFGNKTIKLMFTGKNVFWAWLILAPWPLGEG